MVAHTSFTQFSLHFILFLTSLWIRSIERFKQHGIPWAMDTHLSIYAHEVLHKHPVTNNTQSLNMDRSKWLNARTPNRPLFYQRWCIKIWNTPIITEENLNTKYGSTQIKHQSNAVCYNTTKKDNNNNMEFFFRDTFTHVQHKSHTPRLVEKRSGKSS